MATIFFSYSHVDEARRDQLEVHLSLPNRRGAIETWHDRRITPGEAIDRSIGVRLDTAEVILLLVSPDFVASDYCYDVEMTRALERQTLRVTPAMEAGVADHAWSAEEIARLAE